MRSKVGPPDAWTQSGQTINAFCREHGEGTVDRIVMRVGALTAAVQANMKLLLGTLLNGEVWYEGNTGHRRHYLAEHLVAFASDNETLYPGDVLGTGTVGLSCSMDTGRWPRAGQTMTFEIEGIGTLRHPIVAGERVVDYVLNGMPGLLTPPTG